MTKTKPPRRGVFSEEMRRRRRVSGREKKWTGLLVHCFSRLGGAETQGADARAFDAVPRRRTPLAAAALFSLSLLFISTSHGADSFPRVVEKVKPAVVGVGTYDIKTKPMVSFYGSGFVTSPDGTVVTANHVLLAVSRNMKLDRLRVFFPGSKNPEGIAAAVVARSAEYDLAILKCSGENLPHLKTGKSAFLREGDDVAWCGYPYGNMLGLHPTTHRGIVSSISPNILPAGFAAELNPEMIRALETKYNIFHLDGVAYPGGSGGPVFDPATGEVLGVLVSGLIEKTPSESKFRLPTGISYAVPIEHLSKMAVEPPPQTK